MDYVDALLVIVLFIPQIVAYFFAKKQGVHLFQHQLTCHFASFAIFLIIAIRWCVLGGAQYDLMFYDIVVQKDVSADWLHVASRLIDEIGIYDFAWLIAEDCILHGLLIVFSMTALVAMLFMVVDFGGADTGKSFSRWGNLVSAFWFWAVCLGICSIQGSGVVVDSVRYEAKEVTLNSQTQKYLQDRCERASVARVNDFFVRCGIDTQTGSGLHIDNNHIQNLLEHAEAPIEEDEFTIEFAWRPNGNFITLIAFSKNKTPPRIEPKYMIQVASVIARNLEQVVSERVAEPINEEKSKVYYQGRWQNFQI